MGKAIKKTCKLCLMEFNRGDKKITAGSLGKVHIDCYKEKLIDELGEQVGLFKFQEQLNKEEEKEQKKLNRQKKIINSEKIEKEIKNQFFSWLKESYDISIPKQFFIKIANINNGTYKGLKEGISYEDLLYMFKTKKRELDRIASSKKTQGQGFENNYNRLCFDLAIIVNKYDGYKKWKEKQKLQEIKNDDMKKTQTDLSVIKTKNKITNDCNDDIGDILDEVF